MLGEKSQEQLLEVFDKQIFKNKTKQVKIKELKYTKKYKILVL